MTHVKVAVRVRPLSQREIELKSVPAVSVENGNTISVTNLKIPEQNAGDSRERVRRFTFDFCFEENSTQDDVFKAVEKIIGNAVRKRYHSCVLAYGQSSTGKTHTMMGAQGDPGITPKLCQNIFDYLQQTACDDELQNMKTKVSYLEIYNEKVRDLLVTSDDAFSQTLKIREHPKKGPYVQGLTEHSVFESRSLLEWLQVGNNNRRVGATTTNPYSSRSHSVFTVTCYEGVKLHLVDLAGSERAGSRCDSVSRFREGANINKSLVALGNVISALADKTYSRKKFIPYRDSVLTWLLKDTLGGNSKTIMIATVSPSSTCYNETVNTLRFGQRAKLIISQPVVNEDPKDKTIRELRIEIARLKELLLAHQNSIKEDCLQGKTKEDLLQTKIIEENHHEKKNGNKEINTIISNTEKLIPIMNFNSSINDKNKKVPLQRTYSVDAKGSMNDSQEMLPGTSTLTKLDKIKRPISSTELRKRSVEKPNISLRNMLVKKAFETPFKKSEKAVLTEAFKGPKIEAKVDSIRRQSIIKPRSQIVAAVTNRLYSKVKKKEVATETDGTNTEKEEVPKELQICSNARLKLQELTRQALKAHRRRNEETQTELFPVLRVKEISTDVDDLRLALAEVKDAETDMNIIETKDVAVGCTFLENLDISDVLTPHNYKNAFTVTRTCGTQSCEDENKETKENVSHPNPISFTKYLQNPIQPRFEIVNSCTANPIYTSSVNINVSHNYINSRPSDNVSDDSLDEQNQPNVCFPTPDLISNHNSLEPHNTHAVSTQSDLNSSSSTTTEDTVVINLDDKIRYASSDLVTDQFSGSQNFSSFLPTELCVANCIITPECEERLHSVNIPEVCAAEICILKEYAEDSYTPLVNEIPNAKKATIVENRNVFAKCDVQEPIILKSIMKYTPENEVQCISENKSESSDESVDITTELPDSLNYHKANSRRVHFTNPPKNDRMMNAMSNFLEEAATLMTNLNIAATQIENARTSPLLENYELQVTVNDISCLPKNKGKSKRAFKTRRNCAKETKTSTSSKESVSIQTSPKHTIEVSASTDDIEVPTNKYEALVEESCRKLEERINSITTHSTTNRSRRNSFDSDFLHRFPQPFEVNQAWLQEPEEDSMESTPTLSDYGSLPRRPRNYHSRNPSCSPSAFLRQLTNMRQQIIESSREELNSELNMHL